MELAVCSSVCSIAFFVANTGGVKATFNFFYTNKTVLNLQQIFGWLWDSLKQP